MEVDWEEKLRESVDRACDVLNPTKMQKDYCRIGYYRGVVKGLFLSDIAYPEPMTEGDILSSAVSLARDTYIRIEFFDGDE